jgi:excisionase family DNA binding protein
MCVPKQNGTMHAQPGVRFGTVMKEPNKSNSVAPSKATEQKFSMGRVAEMIRVHVSTVSRLMDNGKLGYYQIGRRRVVGATHLEQYLSAAERQARVPPLHQD